jgi:hypothetical protein
MTTYLGQIRGLALCPLTYIISNEAAVDNAARNAIYDLVEEKLVHCTLHESTWYNADNHCVYNELKTLTYDGTIWRFVQRFDRNRNG